MQALVAVGGAIVNIPLNALLIFGAGLGIAGSAIGTVIAHLAKRGDMAILLVEQFYDFAAELAEGVRRR